MSETLADRVAELRAWGTSRIGACRRQEEKFSQAWEHREKHPYGSPQALVEAWTERRAIQAVFSILGLAEITSDLATQLEGASRDGEKT